MATRAEMGESWDAVVRDWYLGQDPQLPPGFGWDALGALEELWPERLQSLLDGGARGPAIIAPAIEEGTTLSRASGLNGFGKILARIRRGERAALSEATVAAVVSELGYNPAFEPAVGAGFMDLVVPAEPEPIYIEVVTPETSSETVRMNRVLGKLSAELAGRNPGTDLSVYFVGLPDAEVVDDVMAAVDRIRRSPGESIQELSDGRGHVSVAGSGEAHHLIDMVPNPGGAPILGVVSAILSKEGPGGRAEVLCQLADDRAVRTLNTESHQLSRDLTNVLVIDVSQVQAGIHAWPSKIQASLQPTRNTRFGAVALYSGRQWKVVRNQHARKPVPPSFLDKLAGLRPYER